MDWPLHPGAVPRTRHGNAGKPNTEMLRKVRERGENGALVPDSRLLSSAVWQPLPGTTPVSLEHRTGCAWPLGQSAPFTFCNAERKPGTAYCPIHHSIYRSKTTP